MKTLDQAPRTQRLAALCRVLHAMHSKLSLPPAHGDVQALLLDQYPDAGWCQNIAASLQLYSVVEPLNVIVDGVPGNGDPPTFTLDEAVLAVETALVFAQAAIAREVARCA